MAGLVDEQPCVNFARCGSILDEHSSMCPGCIDEARHRQQEFFDREYGADAADYHEWLEANGHDI